MYTLQYKSDFYQKLLYSLIYRVYCNPFNFLKGWGTIYFGGPTSDELLEVNVRVWDNEQCGANYNKLNREILNTMMCAGDDGKDACQVNHE